MRERSPHEVSGGQQQRVAIASVLAMEPEVIVLDEPTSFLDPLSAEKIFEVIHRLNREQGITVILVEHRLDLTAKYANHLIVMDRGVVRFEGNPKEILSSEETRLIGVGIPKAHVSALSDVKERWLRPWRLNAAIFRRISRPTFGGTDPRMIEAQDISYSYPNKVEALKGAPINNPRRRIRSHNGTERCRKINPCQTL